jgi:hypothetical protein
MTSPDFVNGKGSLRPPYASGIILTGVTHHYN